MGWAVGMADLFDSGAEAYAINNLLPPDNRTAVIDLRRREVLRREGRAVGREFRWW